MKSNEGNWKNGESKELKECEWRMEGRKLFWESTVRTEEVYGTY